MKMNKFLALSVIVLSVALTNCAKKGTVEPDSSNTGNMSGPVTDDQIKNGSSSDDGNAMGLQTIHFPYDSFDIVGENKEILQSNLKILKDNPTLNIQIEGHCDERGGTQYNMALGEKRANAVKTQVVAGGVAGSRVAIVTMGKEHPIAQGSGEDVWARNRRGNFVITSK